MGSYNEITTVWFLSHIYKPKSHQIWLYSQWILNSFQVSPACPGMCLTLFSYCSSLSKQETSFSAIQYMLKHFHNYVNWSKWYSQHVNNITDSDSSLFVNKFLHSNHFFICFAHWWTFWAVCIFKISHTSFGHGKAFKHLFSSQCMLSKKLLSTFQSFHGIWYNRHDVLSSLLYSR
jgi:hypothetical protein